jgi:hypothetical protein
VTVSKLIFNEILKLINYLKFDLNSLNLNIICCNYEKSVLILLIAVVLTYPCSNRILEEGKSDMSSSKIGKTGGRTKPKQELLFQLNEDGLKQALSSIHMQQAKIAVSKSLSQT